MTIAFEGAMRASAAETAAARTAKALGPLPEWDLSHLYPSMDSPVLKADLEGAMTQAQGFASLYRGKLAALAEREDASTLLAEAVGVFEKLSDLLGRIGA